MPENRTPTQTLVHVMEDFGRSEPNNCIVIYVNKEGEISWSKSWPLGMSESIGMLEAVKHVMLQQFCSEENKL